MSVDAVRWDPTAEAAPARRWPGATRSSTSPASPSPSAGTTTSSAASATVAATGTRNLVAGIEAADPRPAVLVSSSAVGILRRPRRRAAHRGHHARRRLPRRASASAWEREAQRGRGARPARGPACAPASCSTATAARSSKMLPPFKLGVGGPVAGGKQYLPWIHADDVVALYLAALDDEDWRGPVNASAPSPVTNRDFSKALGRALQPARVRPVPGFAIKAALRRDGRDRHRGPARPARARTRAGVPTSSTQTSTRPCAPRSGPTTAR